MKTKAYTALMTLCLFVCTDARTQELASTKAGQISVTVNGEVVHPLQYVLPDGATVTDALEAAGGVSRNGDQLHVQLLHANAAGNQERSIVNLKKLSKDNLKALILHDGDKIVVPWGC